MGRKKVRKTVSLDPRVSEDVDGDDVNYSALVEGWTRTYYEEGRRPLMDQTRTEQLLDEIDRIETRAKQSHSATMDALDNLREAVEGAGVGGEAQPTEELAEEFDELHEMWTTTQSLKSTGETVDWERSPRQPSHVGIRTHAERLKIPPERLSRELRKRDRREGYVESARADGGESSGERER